MTIKELIAELQVWESHCGDIEVGDTYDFGFSSNFDIGICHQEENGGQVSRLVLLLHFGNSLKLLP